MFVLMVINLYAVRIVLKGLGQEDYGIFNTIAGVVTASSFISSVLALSIQRFFSYYLGTHDEDRLKNIFSVSINIIIVLSAVLILIFETIGLWFVNTQLTIPVARMDAVIWLYQFSLATFIISLFQIPYTAAIFANEDMGIYAIISTIECVLRLLAAILIGKFLMDNLVLYGGGLFMTALIILAIYIFFGRKNYKECHYHKTSERSLYKQLLSFSGWTLFGTLASTGMMQGSTILINIFFGPIMNVAFGIAQQINNAFNALCASMVIPFRPAMIKAYAEKQYAYLNLLFNVSNKFILYTLIAVALPIIAEMSSILSLWLSETNPDMVLFSQLMIIYIVVLAMHNPITIIIFATGHIKEYQLPVESITLMCLPITWMIYLIGYPAHYVFYSMIGVCLASFGMRIVCLKRFYHEFDIPAYFTTIIIPGIITATISTTYTLYMHSVIENNVTRFATIFVSVPALTFTFAYFAGLNSKEKDLIKSIFESIINKINGHRR